MTLPTSEPRRVFKIKEPGGRQFVCFRVRNKLRACTTRTAKTLVKRLHRAADQAGVPKVIKTVTLDPKRN